MSATEELQKARNRLKLAMEGKTEYRQLDRYGKLLDESKALIQRPVLPKALEDARKAYETWRLDRAAWLLPGGNSGPDGRRRIRLRAHRLLWLLVYLGEQPRGPRAPAGQKGYHEILNRIEEGPAIEIEIIYDYDDVCVACIDMSVDGCTKPAAERYEDLQTGAAVAEAVGVKMGDALPARDLMDLVARKIEDASRWVGPSNAPRYRRGRAVWLAREAAAKEKAEGSPR